MKTTFTDTTVTSKEYFAEKKKFFNKHKNSFDVYTSPMDEYDRYNKIYTFSDGAQWYEAMTPVTDSTEIELKKCKVTVEVKFLRTEFWSSEFGSRYYYEKY